MLALRALVASTRVHAATAAYPAPVDSNLNGTIDSAEIQTCINGNEGVIFLPANKTYNIDAPITITSRNGISLVGEGPTTVLPIAGNIEAVVISNGNGCGIRHVKFVGPAGHANNTIRISGGNEHFLENVNITNTYRGIELANGIGPVLVNITMTGLTGDYGIKVDAATGKVDAAQLHGITGTTTASSLEWLLYGRVDGVELQTAQFTGGKRGIRSYGAVGPSYVYMNQVTISNCVNEGVMIESGNDLLVNATTIKQTGGAGFTISNNFIGGAVLTGLTISSAGGHGLQILGGRDIGIVNPHIGGNGSALPPGTGAGVYLAAGLSYVRVNDGCIGTNCIPSPAAGQNYGIYYAGTTTQSDSQDVKIKDVDTTGNLVAYTPVNLPVWSVPSPWVTADIGAVAAVGSASYKYGTFTVTGSGADIWGTADEFRYVYQTSSGNCELVARVATIQNTDPAAKAGVMIRESTAAGSRYAAVFITPGSGVTFQRRTSTGGTTASTVVTGVTAPRWVRIVRTSTSSFRGYYSSNGTTWTQIGSNQTISMTTSARIGMAVTSHLDGTLCTSTLDSTVATP